jgi:hypothetical protein
MKKVITAMLLAGIVASCNSAKTNSETESKSVTEKTTTMSKKETVGTFLGAVLGQNPEKMREVANANYIQHNPFIPTGLEPFIQMMPILKEHGTTAENIRMFEDGNYVFMHNIWRMPSHLAQTKWYLLNHPIR